MSNAGGHMVPCTERSRRQERKPREQARKGGKQELPQATITT